MTSTRPYREALSHDEAMRRILEGSGTQFDPRLVDLFAGLVDEGVVDRIRAETGAHESG